MRIVLTNLSNKLYESSRFQLNDSARKHDIFEINSYDFDELKTTPFYKANKQILDQPNGVGNWAWKPFIILETMKQLSDGDIVIYSDCGIEIIKNLKPLITICNNAEPVLLFANGNLKNKFWTKRDCFVLMDCDQEQYWNGLQCDAAFCLFKKSAISQNFLEEWLFYCTDKFVIRDIPNTCGKKNFWGFHSHRFDQSILSLLAIKYLINLYRQPTQYGNHYKMAKYRLKGEFNCISQKRLRQLKYYSGKPYNNSPYYQLLDHHRSKIITGNKINVSIVKAITISGKRRWGKSLSGLPEPDF